MVPDSYYINNWLQNMLVKSYTNAGETGKPRVIAKDAFKTPTARISPNQEFQSSGADMMVISV